MGAQRIADEAVDDSQKTADEAAEEAKRIKYEATDGAIKATDGAKDEAKKVAAEAQKMADEVQKAADEAQKAADKAFEEIGVSKEAADSIKSRLLKTKQVEEAHLKCCITNSTEDCDVLILKSLSYQFKAKI